MVQYILHLFLFIALTSCQGQTPVSNESHKEVLRLMGTRFELTATATDKATAQKAVAAGIREIERIEALISSWKSTSQTSEINRSAGVKEVVVDKELYDLIARCIKVSDLTQGAFDISFASMERLYTFDKQEHEVPSKSERMKAIELIDYQSIILDHKKHSVYLSKVGMKIGFGAIGKGYAANRAKVIMQSIEGVQGGVVNAAGDLVVWGDNGKEEGWPIQISDPKDINKSLGWLHIKNASVVTSGDYEKYFTNQGIRYAHIINPQTGLPTTGIKSATIVSPDGEVGDALATAVFVMGSTMGLELINKLKNIEVLIITDNDEILTSKNLVLNKY